MTDDDGPSSRPVRRQGPIRGAPIPRAARRDDVLPPPGDFDNPEPDDAPTAEETNAQAALKELMIGLPSWLGAAMTATQLPVEWRRMVRWLANVTALCALADDDPIAVHTPAEIITHPHPPVPKGGICMRCDLPVTHGVHPLEIDAGQ
jgi:hypothetical protein